jgi:recombination protein RecA
VVKNKVAPPFRDAEFDIMFDRGISYEGDLLDLAAAINVVEKSGAWYNYKSTRLGQGRENAKQFLTTSKDLADEIREAVLQSKGLLKAKFATEAGAELPESAEVAV